MQQSVASEHDGLPSDLVALLETIRAAPGDEGVVDLIVRRPAVDGREVVD